MRHLLTRIIAVVALAGLLSSPAAAQSKYRGLTSGEWLAVWWQAVFAIPVEEGSHPLLTGRAFGGNHDMVFVGPPVLPAGSPTVTIPVTIQRGTRLFVPIITVECSEAEAPPFHGTGEAELRACANGLIDLASAPHVEVDGTPVANPGGLRVESPLFRYGPLAARNVLGLRPGTQSDAVGTGYVLLLPPLSVGVHRITIRANVPDFGLAVDAEVIATVERSR